MTLFDRHKTFISPAQPKDPGSGGSSSDPCKDDTFAPRFKEKKISVFISSTFRDMIAERDELTLKIFPQLRKICEELGIVWSEVDLRWGIPPEKSEKGETLNICLQYIDKCRPYFIGMLGERYGWIDPEAPERVKDDFPWVKEQTDKSITELEILHGVLNNPNMEDHVFFYFRDKAYLESEVFKSSVSREDQADFYETEEEPRQRLVDLKERIRKSGFPIRQSYPNTKTLGELVKKDLMELIDALAPPPKELTDEERATLSLDRELAAHETYVASRLGAYIKRKEYFDRLYTHAGGEGDPLVVLGESRSGKSALLAQLATSLANQAVNLLHLGDRKAASDLINEAHHQASEHGYQALTGEIKGIMEQIGV